MTWILYQRSHGMDYCALVEIASNIKDIYTLTDHYY